MPRKCYSKTVFGADKRFELCYKYSCSQKCTGLNDCLAVVNGLVLGIEGQFDSSLESGTPITCFGTDMRLEFCYKY
jgi:hypothetical protein